MNISIVEYIKKRQRIEPEQERRAYLEIPPPPPPVRRSEVEKKEPRRVIEIQL